MATSAPAAADDGLTEERHVALLAELRARLLELQEGDPEGEEGRACAWLLGQDTVLTRFLKGAAFNVADAVKNLCAHYKWRQQIGADGLLEWEPPAVFGTSWPGLWLGNTLDGRPVYYELSTQIDFAKLIYCATREDITKWKARQIEEALRRCREQSAAGGKLIHAFVTVVDLHGLGRQHLSSVALEIFRELAAVLESHYPGTQHQIYVVRAPSIFPAMFKLVRPFFAKETRDKVHVLSDAEAFTRLEEILPREAIPEFFGGGADLSALPVAPVTEAMYCKNQMDEAKLSKVIVSAGASHAIDLDVQEANARISWEFKTNKSDIRFALYRKAEAGTPRKEWEAVRAGQRVESHILPVVGVHECEAPGLYVFLFDNLYSVFTSKTLHFSVGLEPLLPPSDP